MNRKVKFAPGEYYHIYNRGVDKRDIFIDKTDYDRFIFLLFHANGLNPVHTQQIKKNNQGFTLNIQGETLIEIGAYCLMPNHFHLLVKEKSDGGISIFMSKLSTAYTMYFNKRYQRSGALFQGVFKSEHADRDEYLKYLFSYIHLNPVKIIDPNWRKNGPRDVEKINIFLIDYRYSSFQDYNGEKRGEATILNKKAFPEYFEDKSFIEEMYFWLNQENSR
jgi:putative transposase